MVVVGVVAVAVAVLFDIIGFGDKLLFSYPTDMPVGMGIGGV